MEKLNEETKKLMSLAGIKEGDKKYLTNESFLEFDSATSKIIEESKEEESDFIVMEFDQEDVEPGQDDDELYTLK